MDTFCGSRIDCSQTVMHGLSALLFEFTPQHIPQIRVGAANSRKMVGLDQRVDIQTGTAADDGQMAAGKNRVNAGDGFTAKIRHAEALIRFADIDQPMRDTLRFLSSHLGRTNIHAPVDLHGVTGYHFAIECLSNSDRQLGFTAGCGPKYDDEQRLVLVIHTESYAP